MQYNKQTDNWSKELTDGSYLVLGHVIDSQWCLWINRAQNYGKTDEFIWFKSLDEGLEYVAKNLQ